MQWSVANSNARPLSLGEFEVTVLMRSFGCGVVDGWLSFAESLLWRALPGKTQ
jgi:hypothetical protein